jgi:dTDP-glucose 4,6-dehydratase
MKVIFVTGGAGFIGSFFVKYFLRRNKNFIIVNMDKLTYAGSLKNLTEIEDSPRHHFVKGDICNQELVNYILKRYRPDYIINFAAESNARRSIEHPLLFTQTNSLGALTLLEGARYIWSKKNFNGNRFIQVSTDEVYGYSENSQDFFTEESNLSPGNPYAVSKASADMMAQTYYKTYGLPSIITRCCATYGPFQHKENFIPSGIISTLDGRQLIRKPDTSNKKEWIHVQDHCIAIIRTMFYGQPGEIYNIGTGEGFTELELSEKIQRLLGKSVETLETAEDRHPIDKYNSLNSYKIKNNLKWSQKLMLDEGLKDTASWYINNKDFWESRE